MRKLIIVLFVLIFVSDVKATHLMGGEITWECIKTGSKAGHVFQMKLYRDCQGVSLGSSTEYLTVHNSTISSIILNRVTISDLSPTCNTIDGPNPEFSCGPSNSGFLEMEMEQWKNMFTDQILLGLTEHLMLMAGTLLGPVVVEMEQLLI